MTRQNLQIALRAALLSRNVPQLHALLPTYGLPAFAQAVARCSPRVAADVLSLLPVAHRSAVLRHLPRPLCNSLQALGFAPPVAAPVRGMWGLQGWSNAALRAHA